MKNIYILLFALFVVVSCQTEKKEKVDVAAEKKSKETVRKSEIATYNYESLKPLLEKNDDKTYVVNFWATWCAPCVKELPAFEKLQADYKAQNVEVLLVSLDFPTQVQSHLIPFIKDKKLKSKVVLLDDPDQNTWIPKINEKWSGAIPATLIYNKDKRSFYEQSFHFEQLEQEVHKFLK